MDLIVFFSSIRVGMVFVKDTICEGYRIFLYAYSLQPHLINESKEKVFNRKKC